MNKPLVLQLIAVFFIVQALGLIVANSMIAENVKTTIVNDNPNDVVNSIGLIAWILFYTAIILLVLKFFKKRFGLLLKFLETLAIFGTSALVFSIFLGDMALLFAILLVLLHFVVPQNVLLRNISSILAASAVGAIIGVSLGLIPILLFIVLLAVYDLIAVFKTKHMITMAKAITSQNLAFTVALPTKEHQFELGTGDLVIPLAFASSVFSTTHSLGLPFNLFLPMLVLVGSLTGLLLTIDYCSKHVGIALPALPLQTVLMILTFGIGKLLGY